MQTGRRGLAFGAVAAFVACSLPSVDEYARPLVADAGASADAQPNVVDGSTADAGDPSAAFYVRMFPPSRELSGADLTASGPLDWIEWQDPVQRCASCTAYFGTLGSKSPTTSYSDDNRSFTWTNGTPQAMGSAKGGLFIEEVGGALVLPVVLPATPVVLKLHADVFHAAAVLDARLDGLDAVTPASVSVPTDVYGFLFVIQAYAPGKTLRLTWTLTASASANANVAVSAATLAPE